MTFKFRRYFNLVGDAHLVAWQWATTLLNGRGEQQRPVPVVLARTDKGSGSILASGQTAVDVGWLSLPLTRLLSPVFVLCLLQLPHQWPRTADLLLRRKSCKAERQTELNKKLSCCCDSRSYCLRRTVYKPVSVTNRWTAGTHDPIQ